MKYRFHRFAERLFLPIGVTLLVIVAAAMIHCSISSHLALVGSTGTALFSCNRAQMRVRRRKSKKESISASGRRSGFGSTARASWLKRGVNGRTQRRKLKIRVPVFAGTDDLVLNRGVLWIAGTARPGQAGNGNVGMAGHRDGSSDT